MLSCLIMVITHVSAHDVSECYQYRVLCRLDKYCYGEEIIDHSYSPFTVGADFSPNTAIIIPLSSASLSSSAAAASASASLSVSASASAYYHNQHHHHAVMVVACDGQCELLSLSTTVMVRHMQLRHRHCRHPIGRMASHAILSHYGHHTFVIS